MSNGSKRQELYETLFKSIKAELGIDAEKEDPIKAYYEGKYPDLRPMGVMVQYLNGAKRGNFLKGYPEELRQYLWELCEKVSRDRRQREAV